MKLTTRVRRTLLSALLATTTPLLTAPFAPAAWAQASGKKLVAVYSEGANQRDVVRGKLPGGALPADASVADDIFKRAGVATPLGKRLKTGRDRKALAAKLQSSVAAAGATALVITYPAGKKKGRMGVLVVGAGRKAPLGDKTIDTAAKGDKLSVYLANALAGIEPPSTAPEPAEQAPETAEAPPAKTPKKDEKAETPQPAPEPVAEAEAKPEAKPAAAHEASTAGAHGIREGLFVGSIAVGLGARKFAYTDPVTRNLRPYDLKAAPRAEIGLELYPFASTRTTVLRDIGLVGSYARALGLSSKLPDGEKVNTTWAAYRIGARYRLRVGDAHLVGFETAYLHQEFTFAPQNAVETSDPSVSYKAIRLGVDGRFSIGTPAILAGLGYQFVSGAGTLSDRFPHARIGAIDATLGVALPLSSLLEARLQAFYSRYFYNLQPAPGDKYVAGGALDQLYGIQVGVAIAP